MSSRSFIVTVDTTSTCYHLLLRYAEDNLRLTLTQKFSGDFML